MSSRRYHTDGLVTQFLTEDHRRLETLLRSALHSGGPVDQPTYDQFRSGLLRHIGMEEKILLPTARRLRGGEPLALAARLRLDHGAIAALLMPTPTGDLVATLQKILAKHNLIEEGHEGLYETCDALAGTESELLPDLSVLPCADRPAVLDAVRRALERAGYGDLGDSSFL
ncbi:MAG: hemerythrin domain-containing protein [Nitrospira sp.]|nr:hemerythrin domain-containing protein [Nitrospira sp.]